MFSGKSSGLYGSLLRPDFFTFSTVAFHKRYNFQIRLDIHIALTKDYSPYQKWAILSLSAIYLRALLSEMVFFAAFSHSVSCAYGEIVVGGLHFRRDSSFVCFSVCARGGYGRVVFFIETAVFCFGREISDYRMGGRIYRRRCGSFVAFLQRS